jgi:hypothetical protein
MIATNVIDFARARQNRQGRRPAARAGQRRPRLLRYRDGIDGLAPMPQARPSSATILPFDRIAGGRSA